MSTVTGTTANSGPVVGRTKDLEAIVEKAPPKGPADVPVEVESAPDLPGTGGTGDADLSRNMGEARLQQAPPLTAEGAEVLNEIQRDTAGVADTGWPQMKAKISDGSLAAELSGKTKEATEAAKTMIETAKLGEKHLGSVGKQLEAFTELAGRHREAIEQVNSRMRGLTSAIASGQLGPEGLQRATTELAQLAKTGKQLSADLDVLEGTSRNLYKSLKPFEKGIAGMEKFAKSVESITDTKKLTGKMLVGLDMALKFNEFQKQDPQNYGKNLVKAITSTLGKKGFEEALKAANPKLSATETAVGVLKFGLEAMGFKDSVLGSALDAVSQGLPTDAAVKGVEQAIDQLHATADWAKTGNPKEWLELDARNMKGDNGLVMQGAAMIGDLIATGGRNIPTDGSFGVEFAKKLGFWKEEIPKGELGRTAEQKTDLVGKLANGTSTTEAQSDQMRAILASSTPHMAAQVLLKTDVPNLVKSMRVDPSVNTKDPNRWDPTAQLVHDLNAQLRSTTDPGVRRVLTQKLGEVLNEIGSQGRQYGQKQLGEMLNSGLLRDMPASLRGIIRGYSAQ